MKTQEFINDISEIKPEDFNYRAAWTSRETGLFENMLKIPLDEVLVTCKVCLNGYVLSKFHDILHECEDPMVKRYDFSTQQVNSIIFPSGITTFNDDSVIVAPNSQATIEEVITYVRELFENERWLNNEFKHDIVYGNALPV